MYHTVYHDDNNCIHFPQGLGFVYFVLSALVCCQPTVLIWVFFCLFHNFPVLLPSQVEILFALPAIILGEYRPSDPSAHYLAPVAATMSLD